jgi:hypothetical protein
MSFQTLRSLSRTGKNVLESISYPEQATHLFPLAFVTSHHGQLCMYIIFYICSNYGSVHCTLPLLPLPSTIPTFPHIAYSSSTTLDTADNQFLLNIHTYIPIYKASRDLHSSGILCSNELNSKREQERHP